jgi:sporulation protein YlmC with PRC-barrel domain
MATRCQSSATVAAGSASCCSRHNPASPSHRSPHIAELTGTHDRASQAQAGNLIHANPFINRLQRQKGVEQRTLWEVIMADVKNPSDTGGRLIAASKVNGTNVYNTAGEKLGSVYDVMIDKRSGNAEYAVMSFGGFLGVGDSYHPLPWRSLSYDERQGGYVVDLDRSRLEGAPSYSSGDASRWDDPSYGRQVNDYYGLR